uniref:Uncharacterized protein n=1 Tax=Gossypium raimondii TaxID=29730 RepID=A0A0D2R2Y0_GOSRA|nr:hypothetical protein B456_002G090800 [Gossypium raimondii]
MPSCTSCGVWSSHRRAFICGSSSFGGHSLSAFQKSYKPPKRPLTKKEIDELCDEWVLESLIPPITQNMLSEHPVLER